MATGVTRSCFVPQPPFPARQVRRALSHAGLHRGGDGEKPTARGLQNATGGVDLRGTQLCQVYQGWGWGAGGRWGIELFLKCWGNGIYIYIYV